MTYDRLIVGFGQNLTLAAVDETKFEVAKGHKFIGQEPAPEPVNASYRATNMQAGFVSVGNDAPVVREIIET